MTERGEFEGEPLSEGVRLFIVIVGWPCVVSGILGNILIILTLLTQRSLRSLHNLYVGNLAVADFFVITITVPKWLLNIAIDRPIAVNQAHCQADAFLFFWNFYSSMYTLILIAFNRYLSVCKPQWYPRVFTAKTTVYYCAVPWVAAGLECLLPVFQIGGSRYQYDPFSRLCTYNLPEFPNVFTAINVINFVVLIVLVGFFSYQLYTTWKRSKVRVGVWRRSYHSLEPSRDTPVRQGNTSSEAVYSRVSYGLDQQAEVQNTWDTRNCRLGAGGKTKSILQEPRQCCSDTKPSPDAELRGGNGETGGTGGERNNCPCEAPPEGGQPSHVKPKACYHETRFREVPVDQEIEAVNKTPSSHLSHASGEPGGEANTAGEEGGTRPLRVSYQETVTAFCEVIVDQESETVSKGGLSSCVAYGEVPVDKQNEAVGKTGLPSRRTSCVAFCELPVDQEKDAVVKSRLSSRPSSCVVESASRPQLSASDWALIRSIFLVFFILVLLYLPVAVAVTIVTWVTVPADVFCVTCILCFFNQSINWIVYGMMTSTFRKGYKRLLFGRRSESHRGSTTINTHTKTSKSAIGESKRHSDQF